MEPDNSPVTQQGRRFSGMQVLGIVVATLVVAVVATFLVIRYFVFPSDFKPVRLNAKEQQVLNAKLDRLEALSGATAPLEPEAYSEEGASREIRLSEKELNAILANNTDLATRVAIDLSDDLASAKILIPMDPDFPVLGGKTLRVNAGLNLAYAEGRPVIAVRGVSIMGVPMPNAWLGNLKNVNLVKEFGGDPGFWKSFADGVEQIQVEDGRLLIELKE
ncbi:MAG: arginine N-succinyltransferase [Gammaproteobacteria bacterium]|nr:arginine N-succinyltransferase [Gammaproteobacteria bacterium]NND36762.1 arginine N-succinyltransferase [Gammaproteobacteria bacterium]